MSVRRLSSLSDPTLLRSCVSARKVDVVDKATLDVIGSVPDMGAEETRTAIRAAHDAWKGWAAKTGKERSSVLKRWHSLILEHKEDLARILTAESGKPLHESASEVAYGASFVEWFAEEAKRTYGEWIPSDRPGSHIVVTKQPIGPVAAITPWNFPVAMVTRKVSPAIAVGCTVVLKPSELTPFSSLALADLAKRAGLPEGVLSVVTGSEESTPRIGKEMCTNPLIRKIAFTGSTNVGKALMRDASSTVKKVALELGGNAPLIVFDDADVEVAVRETIASKFRNAGQTCVCANRIFVQSGIYDSFSSALAKEVGKMRVGNGTTPGVDVGPLVNQRAVRKVQGHVEDAVAKGADVLVRGGTDESLGPNFYAPCVLGKMTPRMRIYTEETFGPVVALFPFDEDEDAIRMANDTPYGLASYLFTTSLSRAWKTSDALDFGIVGVNEGIISTEVAPFGGVKESGLGREGSHHGTDEFCEAKYVRMGLGR